MKSYLGVRDLILDDQITYQVNSQTQLGTNLVVDLRGQTLTKYDFGLTYEPAANSTVGFKHESTSKDKFQLGKFYLFFFHNASAFQTVGTEFSLDWQKNTTEARLGLTHKFDDKVSGKVKVNHVGHVDGLLKLKLSNTATAVFASSLNLRNIAEQKAKSLPLGVSFDLKF